MNTNAASLKGQRCCSGVNIQRFKVLTPWQSRLLQLASFQIQASADGLLKCSFPLSLSAVAASCACASGCFTAAGRQLWLCGRFTAQVKMAGILFEPSSCWTSCGGTSTTGAWRHDISQPTESPTLISVEDTLGSVLSLRVPTKLANSGNSGHTDLHLSVDLRREQEKASQSLATTPMFRPKAADCTAKQAQNPVNTELFFPNLSQFITCHPVCTKAL